MTHIWFINCLFQTFLSLVDADSTRRLKQTRLCDAWLQVLVMGTSLILVEEEEAKALLPDMQEPFYVSQELMKCLSLYLLLGQ